MQNSPVTIPGQPFPAEQGWRGGCSGQQGVHEENGGVPTCPLSPVFLVQWVRPLAASSFSGNSSQTKAVLPLSAASWKKI